MAQSVLEVQQLTGQARNPVSGQVQDQATRPARVFNLVPNRLGGYSPYGRRSRLTDESKNIGGNPVTLGDDLIGFDELGISSWLFSEQVWDGSDWEKMDKLRLFRGRAIYDQQLYPHDKKWLDTGPVGPLVHLEGAGAYADRNAYLVFDRERRPMEPIVSQVEATGNPGSPPETNTTPATFVDVSFGAGTMMAVSNRSIWRRQSDGNWEQVYEETDSDRGNFRRIAYGGGAWLAPQARTVSTGGHPFTVMRSADDGDNWTQIDPYSGGSPLPAAFRLNPFSLAYAAGVWVIGGRALWANEADGNSGVVKSQDGGVTWIGGEALDQTRGRLQDIAVSPSSGFFATADYVPTMRADPWVSFNGLAWGPYWRPPGSPGGTAPGDSHRIYPFAQRIIWLDGGEYEFIVIHQNGRVSKGSLIYPGVAWPGSKVMAQFTSLIEGGGVQVVHDADIDRVTNTIIAVGQFTPTGEPTEPRVWASTDNGASWERLREVEDALTAPATVVAIDANGMAWYYGGTTEVNAGARVGLMSGDYNIYAVSYFNTQAGRFVYDLSRTTITSQDGGFITFTASGKAQILADNPWMTSEMVDDLRFDVYIQRVAEPIGVDADFITPENTIRYAFTEPFPDGSGEENIDRQLAALPLGRQLIVGGQATTSVFEKSQTALHNGRVWGMLNQEESLWHVDADSISPELSNQHSRFVLGYTEVNWANLMSDRSFIPLTPTQSHNFTGLISTPTGLLVLFDNEVLLVTGDPAFGNVAVETYLDMGGGDEGAKPTKVGGQPFTVWNGRLWALQAGQLQEIAPDQYLPDDPFVRLAPEPQSLSLLALTRSGAVLRYALDNQFWLTDAVTRWIGPWDGDPGTPIPLPDNLIVELLPNCICESGDNTRFLAASGALWTTRVDGEPDAPHVLWRSMDFAEPERRKGLYLVKAAFEGQGIWQRVYDRDDGGFDPDAVPRLIFEAANQSNGEAFDADRMSGQTHADPQPGGVLPVAASPVGREVGSLSWRLPLGIKSRSFDVRLELNGLGYMDSMKLPVRMFHSQGGQVR